MKIKYKNGVKYSCNICGEVYGNEDKFNKMDSVNGDHYCLKCHPLRMSYRQLIEWLAKGNGYLCQQGHYYTTAPVFSMCPVIINDEHYPGRFDDQIPYDEHELVVSEFKDGYSNWKIPTLKMYETDCKKGC